MMRRFPLQFLHRYIILSLVIFGLVQSFKFFSFSNPTWVFHYLNDFLTIPIVALICLHAIWFLRKDRSIRLNLFTIFSLVALFSLFFEYHLPKQSPRFTADVWDVACYSLGGLVFYILQKMK